VWQGSDSLNSFDIVSSILPLAYRTALESVDQIKVEEVRLRVGRPLSVVMHGRETFLDVQPISDRDIIMVLEKLTDASLHSAAPSLAKGFISYKGLRVGVCGTGVINNQVLTGFRNYSSIAIRLPHEHYGLCSSLFEELYKTEFSNTLIISPPGVGKTSLLRELIRTLSNKGTRVAVLDERNELSASDCGVMQFDFGCSSDVMIGVPKVLGFSLLLRGMNPQIIAMDEISSHDDIKIIEQIIGCGVGILATAHGKDRQTMLQRPMYKTLFEMNAFKHYITIKRVGDKRYYDLENANG
jgi:stage III sporulation protein AA